MTGCHQATVPPGPTGDDLQVILPQARIDAMRAAGYWSDRLLTDYLDDAVARNADALAIVCNNSTRGTPRSLCFGELSEQVDRIALGLAGLGVGVGDIVAMQLPNWWQFIAIHLACIRLGAITNPLMPIFRERELGYMLKFAGARVMIVPKHFRDFDYPAMIDSLRPDLPDLQHLLVIGDQGNGTFDKLLAQQSDVSARARTLYAERGRDANRIVQLLYTSGTTGQPKGVMHPSNTLVYGTRAYAEALRLGERTVCFMASPLAHQTGWMYGMMIAPMLGVPLILQDIWDADTAWRLIREHGITFSMGATPFLADLVAALGAAGGNSGTLNTFVCAGAPIPEVLLEKANAAGINAYAGWGMTECGVVTLSNPGDSKEKILASDGSALPGTAVKVADGQGGALPPGQEGDLLVSGAINFAGYLKRPEAYDHDPDGWFKTGDRATMDGDGYIRITGRTKDIIIRGGENIPVATVEDLLYRHPAIADAAVVAMPDERLGERPCAWVTLKPGQQLDLPTLQDYLIAHKLTRQYMPERLEVIDEMPRTASGKIQKYKLREMAAELSADVMDKA